MSIPPRFSHTARGNPPNYRETVSIPRLPNTRHGRRAWGQAPPRLAANPVSQPVNVVQLPQQPQPLPPKNPKLRQLNPKISNIRQQSAQMPLLLRLFIKLYQTSTIITTCLVAAVLVVYGWTVYSQKQWGQEYSKLEKLQRNERYLTSTNEILKNQLAKQAETAETGFVMPSPATTVFIKPSPAPKKKESAKKEQKIEKPADMPLGY